MLNETSSVRLISNDVLQIDGKFECPIIEFKSRKTDEGDAEFFIKLMDGMEITFTVYLSEVDGCTDYGQIWLVGADGDAHYYMEMADVSVKDGVEKLAFAAKDGKFYVITRYLSE